MREGCYATAYFPEEDLISSFRFRSKPVIKPVSNLKLRIIIQVFGLLAPQRIYTSSAESLLLLHAVLRRNTRGLCSQGSFHVDDKRRFNVIQLRKKSLAIGNINTIPSLTRIIYPIDFVELFLFGFFY